MKARFILLCVIGVSQAFNLHARCKSSLTAKCKSSSILSMVVVPDIKQQISEKKQDSVIFEYYNAPRLLDSEAIVSTIKRQIFLLVSALLFGVALETDVLRTKTLSVDKDSVLFGLLFGLPSLGIRKSSHINSLVCTAIIASSVLKDLCHNYIINIFEYLYSPVGSYLRLMIMENMPPDYMRPSTRAANLAILRLFGRKTPDRMVAMSTSVVAFGSGISEEIFFRGFCYTVIAKAFGDMKALLASSLIFATAHYFVFKTNLVTEFIYGILLALLFTTSGYNLCVPIVAHVLHDFFFMFITWKHNARKLGEFAIAAKTDELSRQVSNDPSLFQATSRKV